MTLQQLKVFKKEVRKFYKLIEPIAAYFDNPKETVLIVLIQNLSFDGSDCENFHLEKEVERVEELLKLIKSISVFYDYHFVNWINSEIEMISMGATYTED
ncbi:MAG: hypothetical protein ACJAVA_000299 [Flavobacteriaceae bacterium]|jgi:hypothetical protein